MDKYGVFVLRSVLSHRSNSVFMLNSTPLYNFIACVGYRRSAHVKPLNWVRRRGGGWDENLTKENREFLDNKVIETYTKTSSPLKEGPWEKGEWSKAYRNKRLGLIGIKLGSLPQWNKNGEKVYTSLVQILDNHVIDYIPPEIVVTKGEKNRIGSRDGFYGMQLVGALSADPRMFSPQYLQLFKNSGVPPKRKVTKFMVTPNAVVKPGTPLYATHFRVGDYVDVGAKSIGYGFQGAMKRHGFKGGPRSHGATKFHRKRGTVNSGRKRMRVMKGTKMPSVMGGTWRWQRGLKIWRINTKLNILYIHGGSIPGPTHAYVRISDSCLPKNQERFKLDSHPPFPTFFPDDIKEPLPDELFDENLHQFKDPTIKFEGFQVKERKKRDGAKLAKIK